MIENADKTSAVGALLTNLNALCDTGFALAVHIRYTRPTLLYRTYDRDWVDHYSEKGYMMSDPTVHWGLSHTGAMDWDQLSDKDPEGIIQAARDHGLTNGWTYATGPSTSRSLGSMTRSTPFTPSQRAEICQIIDGIHAQTDGFETFPPAVQEALRTLI
jgi:LuxR family transcriptional regulator